MPSNIAANLGGLLKCCRMAGGLATLIKHQAQQSRQTFDRFGLELRLINLIKLQRRVDELLFFLTLTPQYHVRVPAMPDNTLKTTTPSNQLIGGVE